MGLVVIFTSRACEHQVPTRCAPPWPVPYREHRAGGSPQTRSSGSGSRDSPVPGCRCFPPRLRSLRRSLFEDCRSSSARPCGAPRSRSDPSTAACPKSRCSTEPTFQLGDLQLQPAVLLPRHLEFRAEHRVLSILGLDHSPQPGKQLTL